MANFVNPEFSKILNGQLRPEPLYRTRCGRGRPAARGVAISSSSLADAWKEKSPHPAAKAEKAAGNSRKFPR